MKSYITKFLHDPWGTCQRVFVKLFIAPRKYSQGADYDACRYWQDRFTKYSLSLKGVGDEGLSEAQNAAAYAKAGQLFIDLCFNVGLDLQHARIQEIGCGNGFYTKLFYDFGVQNYQGLDITDVLFPALRARFPRFKFQKGDISSTKIAAEFDLIVMIDVIEHIVSEEKLAAALLNINDSLAAGGTLIIAPVSQRNWRHLFYVRFWTKEDILRHLPGFTVKETIAFRNDYLMTLKKTAASSPIPSEEDQNRQAEQQGKT